MRDAGWRHATVYRGRMWGRRATLCLVRAASVRAIRQSSSWRSRAISGGTLSRCNGERWARAQGRRGEA